MNVSAYSEAKYCKDCKKVFYNSSINGNPFLRCPRCRKAADKYNERLGSEIKKLQKEKENDK